MPVTHQILTALPLGALVGFLLVKGDLCGASAFSEIVVFRDHRKLFGLWAAAVASMVGFAVFDQLGYIDLNPRRFYWASALVGGSIFGVGMVLAGGCVTGTLYKSGIGHANSLFALPFVAAGLWLVDFKGLAEVDRFLRSFVIDGPENRPLSLDRLTGVPYAALVVGFVIITLEIGMGRRRRAPPGSRPAPRTPARWLRKSWPPAIAGLALGLLAAPIWAAGRRAGRDFALGVTDGVQQVGRLFSGNFHLWPFVFVVGIVAGAQLIARVEGRGGLIRKPREQMTAAAIGGLLVGIGAGFGRGCVLGNGVTGGALMSFGMVAFVLVAMLANWTTTRIWVMGGGSRNPRRPAPVEENGN